MKVEYLCAVKYSKKTPLFVTRDKRWHNVWCEHTFSFLTVVSVFRFLSLLDRQTDRWTDVQGAVFPVCREVEVRGGEQFTSCHTAAVNVHFFNNIPAKRSSASVVAVLHQTSGSQEPETLFKFHNCGVQWSQDGGCQSACLSQCPLIWCPDVRL